MIGKIIGNAEIKLLVSYGQPSGIIITRLLKRIRIIPKQLENNQVVNWDKQES
jgi:hypothetical protein